MSEVVVIVSADTEWRILKEMVSSDIQLGRSPFGEWFTCPIVKGDTAWDVSFIHGGWGKISAAASAQYTIDRWHPWLLINIGTCGGFEGRVNRGELLLAEKTIVYDIFEKMGDPDEHLAHYTTELDLAWLREPDPIPWKRTVLVSADKDLESEEIPSLVSRFGAIAGDWESGAIAFVAGCNKTRCMIVKGVSDIVGSGGGEAYSDTSIYVEGTRRVMRVIWKALPDWLMASRS